MSIKTDYTTTAELRYMTDQGVEKPLCLIRTFASSSDGIISKGAFANALARAYVRGWPVTKTVTINILPAQPVPMRTSLHHTTITTTTFEVTEIISRSKAESQFP